jgi:asparagine synthetase B (glutamine-hydrolysing)
MCGIAGFSLSPEDAARVDGVKLTKAMVFEIEHRGRDATGVAWATQGGNV